MSATATITPVPSDGQSTGLTAACFVPLSYIERCLDLDDFTQLRVFSLIMVETLGAYPRPKPMAEITVDRMVETFAVSREWILNGLARLDGAQMIRIGRSERGATCYGIQDEYIQEQKHAGHGPSIKGRCSHCQKIGLFSTEFIPMPHSLFRTLGSCVESAVFRVVAIVCRYTLKWNKETRTVTLHPAELDLNDFTRLTGLEKRQITSALTRAVELGLIGRQMRSGKPSIFWAIPENFNSLEPLEPRHVRQPKKKKAQNTPRNPEPITEKPKTPRAIQSKPWCYGRCSHCGHFTDIEPVTEAEFLAAIEADSPKRPPGRAREGPEPEIWSSHPRVKSIQKQ